MYFSINVLINKSDINYITIYLIKLLEDIIKVILIINIIR
jgi:hypothetical protein